MKTINLIFGCHSHQPVGNFEDVFAMAYDQAYLPFVEVLEKFPDVHVTQHYTGPLFDWFAANRPEFLERLAAMVKRGQVEIMGGGYYEPMVCAIPERDSIAQITRMREFCVEHFGQAPKGMWLTERVWEPHMPHILSKAGVEYTALDDTHFLCAGHEESELFGCYLTEDEGYTVKVFPILAQLRYMVPFQEVSKSIAFLREHATEDGLRCAVIHDDGEKFGVWPGTHSSVYGEGWLEEFFAALTENKDWLHSITYSEYLERARPVGRTYLPTASYHEMMEWALPTAMQRRLHALQKRVEQDPEFRNDGKLFIRGSFWRSFLAKYAESNNVQKRMLRVSHKVAGLQHRKDPRLADAERLLHQGQCNCAYWHGVFGGLYLNHLRTALYEKLIEAESVVDAITHKTDGWVSCEEVDFDADGAAEAVLENASMSLFFSPSDGGTLFEWDYKPVPFNFGNTLTRREEVYHDKLRHGNVHVGDVAKGDQSIHDIVRVKEEGLDAYLVYDPYRRVSLRDHFLAPHVSAEELWTGGYAELGDFATGSYRLTTDKRSVTLTREGRVSAPDAMAPFTVSKRISLQPRASACEIRYDLQNNGQSPITVLFGVEFAVNLLSGTAFDRYYRSDDRDLGYAKLGEMGCDEGLTHLALRDDWARVEWGLRLDAPARIYRFAIETVSQSENGQERVYQGSIVLPCWMLRCLPGEKTGRTITAEILRVQE